MNTLQQTGRRMVFWGALFLLAWAVYELSIRFDEMLIWVSPVYKLVQDGKITIIDYLSRLPWQKLHTHAFLLLCALFSLYALVARRGLIAGIISIPVAVLLIIFSLGSTNLLGANLWQKLKMLPLVLIGAGNILKVISSTRKPKAEPDVPGEAPQTVPYDPFGMNQP
ncbi:MAG: hypothetical protein GXZ04_01885 [Clostridiales bacterium]|nr:hypothetical protein [Clostridiales bacterium]